MIFVDTGAWSLAFRHDRQGHSPYVTTLLSELELGTVVTAGLVLQELLQGFDGPRDRAGIIGRLSLIPLVEPDRDDYVAAADLKTFCRRKGVQIETVDSLLAQLCIRHELTMLSPDRDFAHIAKHAPLRIWTAG